MENSSPVKHLIYLDGLRGLAALFVVLNHAFVQVDSWKPITGAIGKVLQVFSFGRYSVDVFIVLSGFCLMLPIVKGDGTLRGGAANFFRRRAWRILPTYYLALAFSMLLGGSILSQKTGSHWDVSIPITSKSIVSHLLLIHDGVGEYSTINPVFWSIAVEWRIYFLFPLLLWAWRRFGEISTTFVAILASYALFFGFQGFDPQGLTAYYVGLFALGMLAAGIAFSASPTCQRLKNWPWRAIFCLLSIAVAAVSFFRISPEQRIPFYIQDGVVGLWALSLLVEISRRENSAIRGLLSHKLPVFVGTFAYSLYLVHAPVLQILWQYVFPAFQDDSLRMFLALSLVGTPLIVAFSYVFFLVAERPFLRRKERALRS